MLRQYRFLQRNHLLPGRLQRDRLAVTFLGLWTYQLRLRMASCMVNRQIWPTRLAAVHFPQHGLELVGSGLLLAH